MKSLVGTLLIAASAAAMAQNQPIKFGAYADGYWQFDFGNPATGDSLNGRGLDIAHNKLTLSFAQIEASMAANPFGFNVQFYAGRGPELIHLAEPGGRNKYRWIRQAYVTYQSSGKTPVTFDFGKFDTWIGYEGFDNRFQDQYSRSFNWTYSEPTYETGLRASAKLSDKLTGTFYAVQGWNEVEDSNGGKSFGLALSYAQDAKTTITLANHYGDEGSNTPNDIGSFGGVGFANAGVSTVHLTDLIISHQLTPKTKLAFNLDYGQAFDTPNRGTWNGEVVYAKHQISPTQAAALRFERVEDKDGLRVGAPMQFHSLTGTYDHSFTDHLTLRFELRKDFASGAFFNSDSGPKKDRTTLTAAAAVKF